MKRVRPIPNFDEISLKIKNNLISLVNKNIEITKSELGSSYVFWSKKSVKVLSFLFFFLILPPFIYALKHKTFKNKFLSKFNQNLIFEIAMNQIDELEFVNIDNYQNKNEIYKNRYTRRIPMDATIVKESNIVNFKILDKYEAKSQIGLARWIRSNGRTTQVFYKPTGFVKINIPNVLPKFKYSLETSNRWIGKEIELESKKFNKEFQFEANDPIKARMLYTPLAMEETVKYKKILKSKSKYLKIVKDNENIIISFIPKSFNDLNLNVKIISLDNLKKLRERIIDDIINDVLKLYSIVYWVLIPPIL